MTDAQKADWDAWYEPRNQAFLSKMRAGALSDKEILQWKYQRYITDYLKCVQAVDDGVGRVLNYLDESGLAENTIVIYSSDQGFYLGEHGWYDKRWMFEESLRMPFLIRWPGVVDAGVRSKALIQNIDYAPTFLEVAGVTIPEAIQGRSLVPLLQRQGKRIANGAMRFTMLITKTLPSIIRPFMMVFERNAISSSTSLEGVSGRCLIWRWTLKK